MDTIYSDLKPLWHADRIETIARGKAPVPVHLQLVLSDLCNQDCSFCSYRMSGGLSRELFVTAETHNPNRKMPTRKALEIVRSFAAAGGRAIQFTGGGEPTVHPDHIEVFSAAQEAGVETALVTNGVRLTTDASFLRMRWIRVSVDAGTADTYARVRGVTAAAWNRVWANLRALSPVYSGRLGVGFVVTPDNYTEVAECVTMCVNAGVQNLRVGAVFSTAGESYYGELAPAIREEIERARQRAGGEIEVHSMFDRRMGDLHAGHPVEPFCGYQYLTTYIGADLGVYRCCNTAYTLQGKVGDLREMTFSDYLNGIGFDGFDARGCRFCQFRGQNAAISGALAGTAISIDRPADENFV